MPLPAIVETAEQYLFVDIDKMVAAGVPAITANRIVRLREVYNYWLSFPNKKEREIVQRIISSGNVSRSQAYEDLGIIKILLGNLNKSTTDYHRYRFIEMISRAYAKAEAAGDTRSMVAAADKYAKYARLDKEEDTRAEIYDQIRTQTFKFTDNPEVVGIKRIPNIREKIKAKKQQYWNEDIEDVGYEEVDFDIDKYFEPPKPDEGSLPQ